MFWAISFVRSDMVIPGAVNTDSWTVTVCSTSFPESSNTCI